MAAARPIRKAAAWDITGRGRPVWRRARAPRWSCLWGSAPDTVAIEVRDTTPPFVVALAAPGLLWPPDGRLVKVSFDVAARDLCDPSPAITLVAVTSSEPGAGRPWPQYADALIGTDDRGVSLRADRLGTGSGRTYMVTYRAADRSGNSTEAGATVAVPHDQRH